MVTIVCAIFPLQLTPWWFRKSTICSWSHCSLNRSVCWRNIGRWSVVNVTNTDSIVSCLNNNSKYGTFFLWKCQAHISNQSPASQIRHWRQVLPWCMSRWSSRLIRCWQWRSECRSLSSWQSSWYVFHWPFFYVEDLWQRSIHTVSAFLNML